MITHLLINGAQGSGKTMFAELIKSLSPDEVLIIDGMDISDVKSKISPHRKMYENNISESEIKLLVETTNSDSSIFDIVDTNRRIDNFITVEVK